MVHASLPALQPHARTRHSLSGDLGGAVVRRYRYSSRLEAEEQAHRIGLERDACRQALSSLARGEVVWMTVDLSDEHGPETLRLGYCRLMGAAGGLVLVQDAGGCVDVVALDAYAGEARRAAEQLGGWRHALDAACERILQARDDAWQAERRTAVGS